MKVNLNRISDKPFGYDLLAPCVGHVVNHEVLPVPSAPALALVDCEPPSSLAAAPNDPAGPQRPDRVQPQRERPGAMTKPRPVFKAERTPFVVNGLLNLAAASGRCGLKFHEFLALKIPPKEEIGRVRLWCETELSERPTPYGLAVSLEDVLAPQGVYPLNAADDDRGHADRHLADHGHDDADHGHRHDARRHPGDDDLGHDDDGHGHDDDDLGHDHHQPGNRGDDCVHPDVNDHPDDEYGPQGDGEARGLGVSGENAAPAPSRPVPAPVGASAGGSRARGPHQVQEPSKGSKFVSRRKQPTVPESFELGEHRWHNRPSACEFTKLGTRQLTSRQIYREETRAGTWWKQSDLLADSEQRAHEEHEKRQQAHLSRVEAGRANVVHDRWTDDQGQEQALTSHPSYDAIVRVVDEFGLDAWCKEWREAVGWHCVICSLVYETTAVIGPQPARYWYLETIDSNDEYGPETVLWWPRSRRRAEMLYQPLPVEEELMKRRSLAYEQRLAAGVEPCLCTRAYECPDHELAFRVGEPGNPFGVPDDAAWCLEFGS